MRLGTQVFLHLPHLRNYFLGQGHGSASCKAFQSGNPCLSCELDGIFAKAYSGERAPLSPSDFLFSWWTYADSLAGAQQGPPAGAESTWPCDGARSAAPLEARTKEACRPSTGYKQQDAHEFYLSLLSGLAAASIGPLQPQPDAAQEAGPAVKAEAPPAFPLGSAPAAAEPAQRATDATAGATPQPPGPRGSEEGLGIRKALSLVDCVFGGLLRSDVTCSVCGHTSTAFDPFLDISLDMRQVIGCIERAGGVLRSSLRSTLDSAGLRRGDSDSVCAHPRVEAAGGGRGGHGRGGGGPTPPPMALAGSRYADGSWRRSLGVDGGSLTGEARAGPVRPSASAAGRGSSSPSVSLDEARSDSASPSTTGRASSNAASGEPGEPGPQGRQGQRAQRGAPTGQPSPTSRQRCPASSGSADGLPARGDGRGPFGARGPGGSGQAQADPGGDGGATPSASDLAAAAESAAEGGEEAGALAEEASSRQARRSAAARHGPDGRGPGTLRARKLASAVTPEPQTSAGSDGDGVSAAVGAGAGRRASTSEGAELGLARGPTPGASASSGEGGAAPDAAPGSELDGADSGSGAPPRAGGAGRGRGRGRGRRGGAAMFGHHARPAHVPARLSGPLEAPQGGDLGCSAAALACGEGPPGGAGAAQVRLGAGGGGAAGTRQALGARGWGRRCCG